jgi:GNAT superfamily N-acetyltransferase
MPHYGWVRIEAVAYDHPDAARLIGEVQQEYVIRYGGVDDSPVDPAEFTPPSGLFLVGYDGDAAVVCGGWRACGPGGTDAEIRRMYVVPAARGRGLARRMLAELERTARGAGHQRMILETGRPQPEAVALYRSSGYTEIPAYGYYAGSPHSMHFGKVLGAPDMGNAPDLAAMSSPRHRALRSDAVANRDRLLAAATAAVKRDGEKAPMATVAAGAGVGVGTWCRCRGSRACWFCPGWSRPGWSVWCGWFCPGWSRAGWGAWCGWCRPAGRSAERWCSYRQARWHRSRQRRSRWCPSRWRWSRPGW